MEQYDPVDYTFGASHATALTRQLIHARHNNTVAGSTFGTAALDKKMIPMQAGDLILVCGRPGNGKSLVMRHLLYRATQEIVELGNENEATVLVTWEESVEQVTAYWIAVASGISATDMFMGNLTPKQLDRVDSTIVQVGALPLYIVGLSSQRGADGKRRRKSLTTDAVSGALDYLMNTKGLELKMVVMDYLQRIPNTGRLDDVPHYSRCVDWAKDTALQAGCPVVLGTQSGRDVDKRAKHHLPTLSDSQYTSNAEQSADKFFSVWMPKGTHELGERIEMGGLNVTVTENLLILALLKQKYGSAPHLFPMYVKPDTLTVKDMDAFTEQPAGADNDAW